MSHALPNKKKLNDVRNGGVSPAIPKRNELNNVSKDGVRILLVTGASGGHIFPALGFLDTLKEKYKGIETLLVLPSHQRFCCEDLPKGSIINQTEKFQYKTRCISISAIKLSLDFKNLFAILRLFKGVMESLFILWEFRPDIVVGFGSISSVPMVILAWGLGIKTLIHEQNVIPGRANRVLAKFTDRIAVSFAETKDYFKYCQKKIVFTGNPIRKGLIRIDKNKALDFFGFSDDKFTILVMGGSLGSHRINLAFLKAISMISDKSKIQIIHITGAGNFELIKDAYKNLDINVRLFSFLSLMQYAYSAADLIVSRGGATTIAEIMFFGLPAIIIPYPYAYKHQLSNAKVLEKEQAAFIISDEALDGDILRQTIADFMNNLNKIEFIRSGYDSILKSNANGLLVNEVLSLN